MKFSSKEILRRLGAGESIASVCSAAGVARAEFDAWWKKEAESRVPSPTGTRRAGGGFEGDRGDCGSRRTFNAERTGRRACSICFQVTGAATGKPGRASGE